MAIVRNSRVELPVNGDGAYALVYQPDDDTKHPGVVLIQEWWGVEPHILDLAQKLAEQGFIVAVPDLYHGKVATEPDDAQRMYMLTVQSIERAVGEIIGTLNTLKEMSNVDPKQLGLIGFCMGGFLVYTVAERYPDLGAIVPFYGAGYKPTPESVATIHAPVLAVYGSQDQSIPMSDIEHVEQTYKNAGKDITVKIYDAGHAFLNPMHGMGNEEAAADAWPRAIHFLKEHLK